MVEILFRSHNLLPFLLTSCYKKPQLIILSSEHFFSQIFLLQLFQSEIKDKIQTKADTLL